MPIQRLECPECGEMIELGHPVASGTRVRCPECGERIVAEKATPKRKSVPRDQETNDRDRDRRSSSKRAQSNPALLIAGLVGGMLLLATVVAVVVIVIRRGRDGESSSAEPQDELVGRWIGDQPDDLLGGEWEFRNDGDFLRKIQMFGRDNTTTIKGKYSFKQGNVVQFESATLPATVGEVYLAPAELRVFLWTGKSEITGGTLEYSVGLTRCFRRAGKQGTIRDGEGLGGTIDQTRKRVVGLWLEGNQSWRFTEDGKLERLFYSPATYVVLDSKTVEVTDKAGNKMKLELAFFQETMRLWQVEQGQIVMSWYCERAPVDYRDDDPVMGNLRDLIVGRWVSGREILQAEFYEFHKDGQWVRQQEQLGGPLRQQGRYRWETNGNLVLLPYDPTFAKMDQKTRDLQAESSKLTYRVALKKGKLLMSLDADLKRVNLQRQMMGLPPLTGKEDPVESGFILRREK
ncbi:MAG TPA: zinc ribbon domain-containing protein [Gemmata sp.]|jgi:DNA-directed RNA polymerase subunit RPC12/RpoP|nr:zinc ribbon domain-containing protein [Gemmata sp.]